MTQFGYTMMCEQSPPDQLVRDLQKAEAAGFDFSVISDHYQPWLEEQGHSGYAWSILGAAAQGTSTIGLMTYVTCPTRRYHPAVVAQKAATVQILSGGRFRLGLGGFDEIALVQIGSDHQDAFIDWAEKELLPALRSL
jgi:G6PDH family F420-dependent oxidoreductase